MSQSPLVVYRKISPNCTKPRRNKITHIVIHHMAGNCSIEVCGEIFAPVARQASSQYGVGSDGRIGQYCYEENRSWCTSSGEIDHKAITIEVADDGRNPWHTSDKAYKSTVKLCADICKRNGIEKLTYTGDKRGNLHCHCWYANTDCPGGWWLNGKLKQLCVEVNEMLAPQAYTGNLPTKYPKRNKDGVYSVGDGYEKNTSFKTQIKRIQKFCNWMIGANLAVDGCYGAKTKKAVFTCQKQLGLKNPHGQWGPQTTELAKHYRKSS